MAAVFRRAMAAGRAAGASCQFGLVVLKSTVSWSDSRGA